MAVNLLGTSDARVDFGDVAALSGITNFSVCITVNASSIANDERIISQWGGSATTEQAWLIAIQDTDEIGFVVQSGLAYYGRKTSGLNLVTGTTYRIVITIAFGSPPVISIWVNGVSQSLVAWVGSSNVTSMLNSSTSVQVGHETDETVDGIDADYSEFAMFSRVLSNAECEAYGKGFSPALFSQANRILYAPLINTSSLQDRWGGITGTNSSGTNAAHPGVIYPAPPLSIPFVAAAAPTGHPAIRRYSKSDLRRFHNGREGVLTH